MTHMTHMTHLPIEGPIRTRRGLYWEVRHSASCVMGGASSCTGRRLRRSEGGITTGYKLTADESISAARAGCCRRRPHDAPPGSAVGWVSVGCFSRLASPARALTRAKAASGLTDLTNATCPT
jgi:hypothetical protein